MTNEDETVQFSMNEHVTVVDEEAVHDAVKRAFSRLTAISDPQGHACTGFFHGISAGAAFFRGDQCVISSVSPTVEFAYEKHTFHASKLVFKANEGDDGMRQLKALLSKMCDVNSFEGNFILLVSKDKNVIIDLREVVFFGLKFEVKEAERTIEVLDVRAECLSAYVSLDEGEEPHPLPSNHSISLS
jgi:hypothetical protein